MADPSEQIENLRERIKTSDEISKEDKEVLLDFSDQLFLLKSQYSDYRHTKLLRHCTIIAENIGGLHRSLEEKPAAEDIIRWINRNYKNEETNRDYRVALRVFGRRVTDGDKPPSSIDWVPSNTSKNYKPLS